MQYVVAVRALCEFTAKQGDLDLRFTPSPSAQEGIAGHAVVASRRAAGYQTEVSLSGEFRHLRVRGRADGYDPAQNPLEEVKTFRGDLARMPDNHRQLHWAQVRIYGYLLCQKLGLSEVRLALVYFDIGSQKETLLCELYSAESLTQYFEQQCERFLAWAEQELAHRATRDRLLATLRFPHAAFRPGQRQLAEAVYKGASIGCCVLVDEAHNMIERGRKMYSAALDQAGFRQVRQSAPAALKKILDRVNRNWNALHKEQGSPYQVYPAVPENFLSALQQATGEITDYLTDNPTHVDGKLQGFYFDALHFSRVADLFDQHSLFDVTKNPETDASGHRQASAVLCLRNVIPAPFLEQRFAAARSTVLFSATLSPWHFYSDTLGLPKSTVRIDVESPFSAEQLSVQVVRRISTRYQHRDESLSPIVDLIASQYARQPGNYLTFVSSYDYLQKVSMLFRVRYPDIPMWEQARRMEESEREQFLARFTPVSQGIGFAVLGGAFAEGIDLPGERLIGAFIATLGLPQMNPVNEQIMQRMNATFGTGYDYAYLYPGIQKVVQAAGRVIRTQLDRGIVYLIDDRFARPEVLRLLPNWWKIECR